MSELSLTYSLADQNFARTKSLGILNLSVHLAQALAASPRLKQLTVLSNHSLDSLLRLQPGTAMQYLDGAGDSGLGRLIWDQWRCYSAARQTGNKWLLLPKGFASFTRKPPVRLAAYMHDTIHEFYDTHFPGVIPMLERRYFGLAAAASLRHASVILTNSEFTRSEVCRLSHRLGLPEPRVVVAGIGFDPQTPFVSDKANRIVVLTGTWPHKRADLALSWTERWRRESAFAGEIHCVGGLPKSVAVPDASAWRRHARLSNTEYDQLLRSARVVVYFSEYEGFGMPPVEATLSGGTPVFSELPATREVMGGAGFPFANQDFDSFRRAMDAALITSAEKIADWRTELVARHNWDAVVERALGAMQRV